MTGNPTSTTNARSYCRQVGLEVYQGTQTDEALLITEQDANDGYGGHSDGNYATADRRSTSPRRKEFGHKLRKSASFSSSSGNSLRSSSMGSATSTMSLRSSPLRATSTRTLKSDTINTFQKWETTIESVSFVTTKTIAIGDYPTPEPRQRSASVSTQSAYDARTNNNNNYSTLRSRSVTPSRATSSQTDIRTPSTRVAYTVKQTAV